MSPKDTSQIAIEILDDDTKWLQDVKNIILSTRGDLDLKGLDKVLLNWTKTLDKDTITREVTAAMNWLVSSNKKYRAMSRFLNSWLKNLNSLPGVNKRVSSATRLQRNPVSSDDPFEMLRKDFCELFAERDVRNEREILAELAQDRDMLFGMTPQKIKTIEVEEIAQ